MTKEIEFEFVKQCQFIGLKPTPQLKTLFISGVKFGLEEASIMTAKVFGKARK